MKALKKIDRFYIVLSGVLLLLAAPLIYTGLGIFSALITAGEIDTNLQGEARVDKVQLETAVTQTYEREIPELAIRETYLSLPAEEPVDEGQ